MTVRRNLTNLGVLALVASLASCKGATQKDEGRMVAAAAATLRDAVRLSGTVEPVVSVDLKAEVSGRIVSLPREEGAQVAKGDLLVQLDPEPFRLKVDRAQLAVDRARLSVGTARRELARGKALVVTGTLSADALEDLETSLRKVELDERDALLQLREARKDLANASVRSPMAGRLITLNVEEGEMASAAVSANGGTELGVVADPARMKVTVEVGELDYGRLRLGMPVEVGSGAEGGGSHRGTVSFISSSARASSGSSGIQVFPVEVTLSSDSAASPGTRDRRGRTKGGDAGAEVSRGQRDSAPKHKRDTALAGGNKPGSGRKSGGANTAGDALVLVPGMTVAVDFVFMERNASVAVPPAAVVRKGGATLVKVRTAQGELEERTVVTGATDYRRIEIVEGLSAGDSVFVAQTEASAKRGPGGPP